MIETGEVRKLFTGPPEVVATLVHQARVLLGMVKNDMRFNGLLQGERRERVPVNQRLLAYSDSHEGTAERQAVGIALISAGSRFGQDWIGVDASEVTITTIPEGPYIPYLWVGLRTEGEGSPSFEDGERSDWYNHAMLHVFEPVDAETLSDIQDSNNHQEGLEYVASSTIVGSGHLRISTDVADFHQGFDSDVPREWKGPLDVYHTVHNLYQVGHGIAPLVSPANNDEEPWQKAVVLDPADPEKEFDSSAPYMYGNFDYPAKAISEPVRWQLLGEVRPGKYLVKVQISSASCIAEPGTFLAVAGPALDVIVRVRVGKLPGRVTEVQHRISFDKYTWSSYDRDIQPNGSCFECTPDGPDYSGGPNPHGPSWWQGGFLVDVQNGTIERTGEEVVPEWGFDTASENTVKFVCWDVDRYGPSDIGGISIQTETRDDGQGNFPVTGVEMRARAVCGVVDDFWNPLSVTWTLHGNTMGPVDVYGHKSGNQTTIPVGEYEHEVAGWTGWIPVDDVPNSSEGPPDCGNPFAVFWAAQLGNWTAGCYQGESPCWFQRFQSLGEEFPEGEDHTGQVPIALGADYCGETSYKIYTLSTLD